MVVRRRSLKDASTEPAAKRAKIKPKYEPIDHKKRGVYLQSVYDREDDGEPFTSFRWRINLNEEHENDGYSPVFVYESRQWKMLFYSGGNKKIEENKSLSIYLSVADRDRFMHGHWLRECRFSYHVLDQKDLASSVGRRISKAAVLNKQNADWGFHEFMLLKDFNDPNRGYNVDNITYLELRIYHHLYAIEDEKLEGNDILFVKKIMYQLYEHSKTVNDNQTGQSGQWVRIKCLHDVILYTFLPMLEVRCPALLKTMKDHQIEFSLSRYATEILLEYVLCDKLPNKTLNKLLIEVDNEVLEIPEMGEIIVIDDPVQPADPAREEKVTDVVELYLFLSEQNCSDLIRLQYHLLACIVNNLSATNVVRLLLRVKRASVENSFITLLFEQIAPYLCARIRDKQEVTDLTTLRDGDNSSLFFDIVVNYQQQAPDLPQLSESTFLKALNTLYSSTTPQNTDVKLYLDEEHEDIIYAHKTILAICCPFLSKLFARDKPSEINLYDVEDFQDHKETMTAEDILVRRRLLAQLIQYFYTGKYSVTISNAFTLLSLCSFFGGTSEMISACEQIVAENLSVDNIFIILNKFANVDHLGVIRAECLQFCATRWREIVAKYTEQEIRDSMDPKFSLDLIKLLYNAVSPFQ